LAQATDDKVEKPAEDREDSREGFEEDGQKLVDALVEKCREIKVPSRLSLIECSGLKLTYYETGNRSDSCEERRQVAESS
jgi:hypothetical protein